MKLPDLAALQVVDGGLAAGDVRTGDEQDQHPVDAVAMHALRRGLARLAWRSLDAELVKLDMPGAGAQRFGRGRSEDVEAGAQDRVQRRMLRDCVADRLEPAGKAAIQRVVVPGSGNAAGAACGG